MGLLLTPSYDSNGALFRLTLLRAVQNDVSQESINEMVRADGEIVNTSFKIDAATYSVTGGGRVFRSKVSVVRTNNVDLLIAGGVSNREEGEKAWETYYNAGAFHTFLVASDGPAGLIESARQFMLNPQMSFASANFQIIAYSYGAAWSHFVWNFWNSLAYAASQKTFVTFGGTKAAKGFGTANIQPTDTRHWFLSDDPVPLIPPNPTSAQRILAGMTVGQGQNISGYSYCAGGVEVTLSNLYRGTPSPDEVGLDPVTAIRNWISVAAQGLQNSHSLDTYIARFNAAGARLPEAEHPYAPDTATGGTGGGGDYDGATNQTPAVIAPIATVGEIRAAEASVVQTQFESGRVQSAHPPIIPQEQEFIAFRRGRLWFVSFRGQTIAAAPHRRGARALANAGNDMLRKLQIKATVDPEQLVQAMSAYLASASDGAQGFSPPMAQGLLT